MPRIPLHLIKPGHGTKPPANLYVDGDGRIRVFTTGRKARFDLPKGTLVNVIRHDDLVKLIGKTYSFPLTEGIVPPPVMGGNDCSESERANH